MREKFILKKGVIVFDNDTIFITDDAATQKMFSLLIAVLSTLYFIQVFFRSLKTGDQFDFWLGLLFILTGIPLIAVVAYRTTRSELSFNEIKSMKITRRLGNHLLDIKLKNNRSRRVSGIVDPQELQQFIAKNFKEN